MVILLVLALGDGIPSGPMKILLLTPPMTQLNTPYPATAYLKGFLRSRGIEAAQADPALELFLRLFSSAGLARIRARLEETPGRYTESGAQFLAEYDRYARTIDSAIRFLQGKDPSLAMRIASRRFLPEGARFRALSQFGGAGSEADQLAWAFGALGVQDQAKYLASLYLDDLADVVRDGIDSKFLLSRYGEKLAASQSSFDELAAELSEEGTLVDEILREVTADLAREHAPDLVAFTAPFPGNVYGAFRMAQAFRRDARESGKTVRTILGGGYPNTELRELTEPRVFDFFDAITLDDGERPFLCLLEYFSGARKAENLLRTFVRAGEGASARVVFHSDPREHDIPQKDVGAPVYAGLPLDRYLSIFELPNPMHRIWSDGRWNKLTLAHGCYWKKCSFCDVSLDYIGRYDANPADLIVDRMVAVMAETGQSGFHFVDEAAPPALLRAMAERLIARNVQITWWGNVRFEKTFTPELCELLAASGCVAISGGLEVASDRLLKKMNKGVTVEQVARVTKAFADAGVLVHAYLMYGFPTQTAAETVDALERVRQLFEAGCIQSAYWHRFSATVHSPVGRDPEKFGIVLKEKRLARGARRFARNDLPFEDPSGVDHDSLGEGLRRALYNYMHGLGFDLDVREWFVAGRRRSRGAGSLRGLAPAQVPADFVARALAGEDLGGRPGLTSAVESFDAGRSRNRI
ncbi:MAG: radical SAM protein [Bdellovibrionales bacterium]|nr:radical SAM protein [Bdellovibrionales bacterium]